MIISNDMIYILVRLLSEDPNKRFNDVNEVRKVLNQLKENLENSPSNLRLVLGHPKINGETISQNNGRIELSFKEEKQTLNEFALKYLAKFIYSYPVYSLSINGGKLCVEDLKMDNVILLNLSGKNLYSEDLYILSQFLK